MTLPITNLRSTSAPAATHALLLELQPDLGALAAAVKLQHRLAGVPALALGLLQQPLQVDARQLRRRARRRRWGAIADALPVGARNDQGIPHEQHSWRCQRTNCCQFAGERHPPASAAQIQGLKMQMPTILAAAALSPKSNAEN